MYFRPETISPSTLSSARPDHHLHKGDPDGIVCTLLDGHRLLLQLCELPWRLTEIDGDGFAESWRGEEEGFEHDLGSTGSSLGSPSLTRYQRLHQDPATASIAARIRLPTYQRVLRVHPPDQARPTRPRFCFVRPGISDVAARTHLVSLGLRRSEVILGGLRSAQFLS